MTNELAISDGKLPILMKGGLVHWVSPELHAKVQKQLSGQSGHTFMTLTELGCTINTAEIEAPYTLEQYAAWSKAKQGMWQCEYRNWHKKNGECECKAEWRKREAERRDATARKDEAPPTPEQRTRSREIIARINKERPLFGKRPSKMLKRSALNRYERNHGHPYVVPEGMSVDEDTGVLTTK